MIESFLPGTGGGGPVRALSNLLHWAGSDTCFRVLTRDHDYLHKEPYPGIATGDWCACDGGEVLYSTDNDWFAHFESTCQTWRPDWIYLNGLFAPMTRRILRSPPPGISILLAPHGNLGPAALRKGRLKKRLWLCSSRVLGRFHAIRWHAASDREAAQIRQHVGADSAIVTVPMAPAPAPEKPTGAVSDPQRLRLVYFGRHSWEKNLSFAFDLLSRFARQHPKLEIVYDLFLVGSERPGLPQSPPENLDIRLHPALPQDALREHLRTTAYDVMLMPSRTENFSYTVLEAMQAGIAPLISDQTPWRHLESDGVGWDLPLDSTDRWLDALSQLAKENAKACLDRRQRTFHYAKNWIRGYSEKVDQLFAQFDCDSARANLQNKHPAKGR